MRVVASREAVDLVREQGGRLYVWPKSSRCCHGFTYLEAGPAPRAGSEFWRVPADGFDLFLARMGRVPEELHIDVRRRHVEAYWDGCAFVT